MWDRRVSHDRRESLFGGRGAVCVWSLAGQPMRPFTALLACELEPGSSVGPHVQAEFPECVIVIEGHGAAHVAEVPQPLEPGTVVFLPLGSTLALENTSLDAPLRYLIVKVEMPRSA
jgi:hypothetical protein